jgi:hypothetical protein
MQRKVEKEPEGGSKNRKEVGNESPLVSMFPCFKCNSLEQRFLDGDGISLFSTRNTNPSAMGLCNHDRSVGIAARYAVLRSYSKHGVRLIYLKR